MAGARSVADQAWPALSQVAAAICDYDRQGSVSPVARCFTANGGSVTMIYAVVGIKATNSFLVVPYTIELTYGEHSQLLRNSNKTLNVRGIERIIPILKILIHYHFILISRGEKLQ